MTKKQEVYKCLICGNIVEMLHEGVGQLVCCGQPMKLFEEQTEDSGYEKHVPVIEKTAEGIKVTVGGVRHPMEEKHYIEWIELNTGEKVYRQFLKPGQEPVALFKCALTEKVTAREYCNIHGLWKA